MPVTLLYLNRKIPVVWSFDMYNYYREVFCFQVPTTVTFLCSCAGLKIQPLNRWIVLLSEIQLWNQKLNDHWLFLLCLTNLFQNSLIQQNLKTYINSIFNSSVMDVLIYFAKLGCWKRWRHSKSPMYNLYHIFYIKTNENYCWTDRPNVTHGQIRCNLETEHLYTVLHVKVK